LSHVSQDEERSALPAARPAADTAEPGPPAAAEPAPAAPAARPRRFEPLPKPGEPIPEEVRKSWWWKILLAFWFVCNLFVSAAAIASAVDGEWSAFVGIGIVAIGLWVGLWIVAKGKVPPDFSP
jgi:hypothetical protein